MRPKKTRWVKCSPADRCFRPKGKKIECCEGVTLTLDELEAIRLADLLELSQEETARKMKVHRSTISRILTGAHKKIADALVNVKIVKVEGGCCKLG